MANRAWLESSLQRSASLGLEVLERASRRSVDWTSFSTSQTSSSSDQGKRKSMKGTTPNNDDAFETMAEFMAQTAYQCKRFYESDSCTKPSDIERRHVCRFHTQPTSGMTTSLLPTRKHVCVSEASEDFYIEVSPGTYTITASMPESQQQSQLVSIAAGESVSLTFNL